MKPPFTLIPDTVSKDTVEALEQLLAAAKRKEVIGIGFAAMLKGRRYIVNSTGEVARSPTFARGLVATLDDHFRDLLHES